MNFNEFKESYQKAETTSHDSSVGLSPLVSICLQTYQHASYIRQCLDGVLMQQTNFDFEILIGEDSSTDGTREICMEYANKYPHKIRLFLHSRENNISIGGNPTGRFNFMYNLFSARGKFIALCEGDDYWTDPLKLQKQVDFLEKNQDYILCFHETLWTRDEQIIRPYSQIDKEDIVTEDLFGRHFIATCSIVFRNQIEYPSWFTKVASGDKLLLYLASTRGKIRFINETMGVYRVHGQGMSGTHVGIKKVYDTAVLLSLFNEHCNGKFLKNCHDSLLYEIQTHLVSQLIKERELKNKLDYFAASLLFKELVNRLKRKARKILHLE